MKEVQPKSEGVTRRRLGELAVQAAAALFLGARGVEAKKTERKDPKKEVKNNYAEKEKKVREWDEYAKSENFKKTILRLRKSQKVFDKNINIDYSKYIPIEGEITKIENANFNIFKENLGFAPGRQTMVVSDYWQTACVYNADGSKQTIKDPETGELLPLMFQVGTGKSTHSTELGLYEIEQKQDENYVSNVYPIATTEEKKKGKKDGGGPMPWAMWLSKVLKIGDKNIETKGYDGTAFHGRESVRQNDTNVRQSHGCIGSNKLIAEFMNKFADSKKDDEGNIVGEGSFVLVVDKEAPKVGSVSELINSTKEEVVIRDDRKKVEPKVKVNEVVPWDGITYEGVNDRDTFNRLIEDGELIPGSNFEEWQKEVLRKLGWVN